MLEIPVDGLDSVEEPDPLGAPVMIAVPWKVSDDLLHRPGHIVSSSLLLVLAIDSSLEVELLRIRNYTRSCDSCSNGSKTIN